MSFKSAIFALLAVAVGVGSCKVQAPLSPVAVSPTKNARKYAAGRPAHYEGATGPGSLYSIDVPGQWNGDLVVWVHGYTHPDAPVALPNIAGFRDFVMARGFAIAVSSFSENGYAVAQAVRQTHQLNGLFSSMVRKPSRVYLVGVSLGGIIGLQLVEKYPDQYDGALLVSGVVGGTRAEVEYIGDVRSLFDRAYPGCLPGDVVHSPGGPFPQNDALACIQANPAALPTVLFPPRMKPPGINQTELVTSVLTAMGFAWFGGPDLFDRTHQHQLYDNDGHTYTSPLLPAPVLEAINAGVTRYSATPDAEAFMAHYYEPTGCLGIPVLTLHNPRDPVVPIEHEALFAAKVAACGRTENLRQWTRGGYGHVVYDPAEIPSAFLALVGWVTTGQKPPA